MIAPSGNTVLNQSIRRSQVTGLPKLSEMSQGHRSQGQVPNLSSKSKNPKKWVLKVATVYSFQTLVGIVTGCRTRVPVAAGYSRVRVRVGFIQPRPYPYPQPGVGGSAHIFKLRAKSTQTMPDASFWPYVGMFSSFFFAFFSKLTHSL